MKFVLIVKATGDAEPGAKTDRALVEAMRSFNDTMMRAGIVRDGMGLMPSSRGARIHFKGRGAPIVVDRAFAESKELIAGLWVIDVASLDEAIAWAKRCPSPQGLDKERVVEIRRVDEDLHEMLPDGITREQFDRLNAGTKV